MSSSRIDLKNPVTATVLAWLLPGLGHAYQGRWFKAVLYSLCIWSTFGCGWVLGDGKVVYFNTDLKRGRRPIGYAAQVLVGAASLPALYQTRRATPLDEQQFRRDSIPLERRLEGEFEGWVIHAQYTGGQGNFKIRGQIEIEPSREAGFDEQRLGVKGTIKGTLAKADEQETNLPEGSIVELQINRLRKLEPAIFPSRHRELECDVRGQVLGPNGGEFQGVLKGKIQNVRSLWNRFAAPLDAEGVEATHGDLGKFFEIGLVYTWIAGLLNLLAMWDAYEGPAYGYGDEKPPGPPVTPPDPEANPSVAEITTTNNNVGTLTPPGSPPPA